MDRRTDGQMDGRMDENMEQTITLPSGAVLSHRHSQKLGFLSASLCKTSHLKQKPRAKLIKRTETLRLEWGGRAGAALTAKFSLIFICLESVGTQHGIKQG